MRTCGIPASSKGRAFGRESERAVEGLAMRLRVENGLSQPLSHRVRGENTRRMSAAAQPSAAVAGRGSRRARSWPMPGLDRPDPGGADGSCPPTRSRIMPAFLGSRPSISRSSGTPCSTQNTSRRIAKQASMSVAAAGLRDENIRRVREGGGRGPSCTAAAIFCRRHRGRAARKENPRNEGTRVRRFAEEGIDQPASPAYSPRTLSANAVTRSTTPNSATSTSRSTMATFSRSPAFPPASRRSARASPAPMPGCSSRRNTTGARREPSRTRSTGCRAYSPCRWIANRRCCCRPRRRWSAARAG